MMNAERRFESRQHAAEIRAGSEGSGSVLSAVAAVYMRYSQNLGGFVEQISPTAFDRVLTEGQDTYALLNHDESLILGRTLSGTLRITSDVTGLRYQADLPDTTQGRDLSVLVARGDITGSSFSFRTAVDGDTWSATADGFPLRTVTSVARLYDVGPVSYPAYLQTHEEGASAAMRSLSLRTGRDADELVEASRAGRLHELVVKELREEGTSEKPAGLSPELILARIDAERRRLRIAVA
jgi:uncharacterized protein